LPHLVHIVPALEPLGYCRDLAVANPKLEPGDRIKMTRTPFLKLGLALGLCLNAFAQGTSAPPTFSVTAAYSVPYENRAAYERIIKGTLKPVLEARLKEFPTMMSIVVTRAEFAGVPEPPANYFLTMFWQGIPKDTAAADERLMKQVLGKSWEDMMKELGGIRKYMGMTMARQITGTPISLEGDFIRLDRKKATPGRIGDYYELERNYLPLREAQVKAGNMKSWSAWGMALPVGLDTSYDAYTAHVVKDLQGVFTWNANATDLNAKLAKPLNAVMMGIRGQEVAKQVHTDVRRVVMVIRKPAS
jgi:hypothetical protein